MLSGRRKYTAIVGAWPSFVFVTWFIKTQSKLYNGKLVLQKSKIPILDYFEEIVYNKPFRIDIEFVSMICAKFNCASNNVKCVLYFFIKDLSYS
jgi:hypothetical protein